MTWPGIEPRTTCIQGRRLDYKYTTKEVTPQLFYRVFPIMILEYDWFKTMCRQFYPSVSVMVVSALQEAYFIAKYWLAT